AALRRSASQAGRRRFDPSRPLSLKPLGGQASDVLAGSRGVMAHGPVDVVQVHRPMSSRRGPGYAGATFTPAQPGAGGGDQSSPFWPYELGPSETAIIS